MIWAALMFASAGLNLVIAVFFTAWWPLSSGYSRWRRNSPCSRSTSRWCMSSGQARLRRRTGGELQPLAAE